MFNEHLICGRVVYYNWCELLTVSVCSILLITRGFYLDMELVFYSRLHKLTHEGRKRGAIKKRKLNILNNAESSL